MYTYVCVFVVIVYIFTSILQNRHRNKETTHTFHLSLRVTQHATVALAEFYNMHTSNVILCSILTLILPNERMTNET